MIRNINYSTKTVINDVFIKFYKYMVILKNKFFPNIKLKNSLFKYITIKLMNSKLSFTKTELGTKLFLDKNDSLSLSFNKVYECKEVELLKKIIKQNSNIIDIGANIGYYTTFFSLTASKGNVFGFEPEISNLKLLKKNIRTNKCSNITLFENSVGEICCESKLYLSDDNSGDHRCYSLSQKEYKVQKIKQINLDSINFNCKIDLIKIDIQGYEYKAFKGMIKLIKNNRPTIMSEFWPHAIKLSGERPIDFLNFFHDLKYDIFDVNKNLLIQNNQFKRLCSSKRNDMNLLMVTK